MLRGCKLQPVTTPHLPGSETQILPKTSCFAGLRQNSTFWDKFLDKIQVSDPGEARGSYRLQFAPPQHCIFSTTEHSEPKNTKKITEQRKTAQESNDPGFNFYPFFVAPQEFSTVINACTFVFCSENIIFHVVWTTWERTLSKYHC